MARMLVPPTGLSASAGGRKKRRRRRSALENGPHAVDQHIGARVRLARLLDGKTQQWLGEQVHLSFQQIQKYERGASRVSCSMLSEFATALERPVDWFFEEAPLGTAEAVPDPAVGERQRLIFELTSNFARINAESTREHIVGLVRAIAEGDVPDTKPPGGTAS
jgi:transcriptional regulator with XRE-family HTH domain